MSEIILQDINRFVWVGWFGFFVGFGHEFGVTLSMFRGCSKSVVVGEARSESISKNFPFAIDKTNDFTSIDAL